MAHLRRSPSALVIALAVTAACFAMGCASKPNMRVRHAEVSGVQLGIGQLGLALHVVVEVYNPNSYDVAIRAVRGTVSLGGRAPMPVEFRAPGDGIWLAAKRVTTMRVPVVVPAQVAFEVARDTAFGAEIPYRMIGRADVTATSSLKIEKDDYSVDEEGTISRAQLEASIRALNPFGPR